MDVKVLGPMHVTLEGRTVPLGGKRQRAVFALLVAALPDGITMDRLVVGAYGPDASATVHRSIRTFLSRFRSALGPERIVREGQLFRLVVDDGAVDAHRFERLVDKARKAATTQPQWAAEQLEAALQSWRGSPFEDVDAFTLDPEVERLEELRWTAIEERLDLDMAVDRHAEMLSELGALVAERPWHERLCRAHALALHRSGRHAEALGACRRAIACVRRELGIEPGMELRELERRLLTANDRFPHGDTQPQSRAWRSAPARYTTFVGRSGAMAELATAIDGHRLVTVTGVGGIGKSSLVGEVARLLQSTTPVVWVPIETERDAAPIDAIASSFGIARRPDVEALEAVCRAVGGHPVLIVLDGCEHVIDGLTPVVHDLLSRAPALRLVLTSREALGLVGEHVVHVAPLGVGPSSPSVQLFLDRVTGQHATRDEIDLIIEIVERVDGHPLAIELAAAACRTTPLHDVVGQLDDQPATLRVRRSADCRHLSLVAALDWSFERLDRKEQGDFCRLAVFSTGIIDVEGAEAVLVRNDADLVLAGLAERSMLSGPDADGRYRMLEPVRQYAAQRLDERGRAAETELRHARWIVDLADRVDDLVLAGHAREALAVLAAEAPAILSVARRSVEREQHDIVVDLVAAIGRYWFRVADCAPLVEPVLAAIAHEPEPPRSRSVRGIAGAAFLMRFERPAVAAALLERLERQDVAPDDHRSALLVDFVRASLGHTLDRRSFFGDHHVAQRSLELMESVEHHRQRLGFPPEPPSHGLAICLEALGRLDECEAALTARAEWAGTDRPIERGIALEFRAMLVTTRGDHLAALADSREAVRLLADHDVDFAASAELAGAWAYLNAGDADAAADALERSDLRWRQIGLPPAAVDRPELVALVAAGRRRWNEFLVAVRRFFEASPHPSDGRDYELMLAGERGVGFHFPRLIAPTAEWLIASGREIEAAELVAAAPSAFAGSRYGGWEAVGDVRRIRVLTDRLGDVRTDSVPSSLAALFHALDAATSSD